MAHRYPYIPKFLDASMQFLWIRKTMAGHKRASLQRRKTYGTWVLGSSTLGRRWLRMGLICGFSKSHRRWRLFFFPISECLWRSQLIPSHHPSQRVRFQAEGSGDAKLWGALKGEKVLILGTRGRDSSDDVSRDAEWSFSESFRWQCVPFFLVKKSKDPCWSHHFFIRQTDSDYFFFIRNWFFLF